MILFFFYLIAAMSLAAHIFSCLQLSLERYRNKAEAGDISNFDILLEEGLTLTDLTNQESD